MPSRGGGAVKGFSLKKNCPFNAIEPIKIKRKLIHLLSVYILTCPHNALESHLKLIASFVFLMPGNGLKWIQKI